MRKKINYMGLSELMRMIIIFVTFCLNLKKKSHGTSLVAQWLRIHLPMQGAWV